MKYLTVLLFTLFCFFRLYSQNEGRVEIIQDPKIDELVKLHTNFNEHSKGINGYRIQIFFDSGNNARSKAEKVRYDFLYKYPDTQAYLLFQQPYFKIRIGDFRTRLDAERFLKTIESEFQNSFIVKDIINFPKL
ncbi:MAG: SPOR domain-containing protein [Bacteroidales bacterium]|nr:SPOR domain-containing protein [Bacteroidales bacterium]